MVGGIIKCYRAEYKLIYCPLREVSRVLFQSMQQTMYQFLTGVVVREAPSHGRVIQKRSSRRLGARVIPDLFDCTAVKDLDALDFGFGKEDETQTRYRKLLESQGG